MNYLKYKFMILAVCIQIFMITELLYANCKDGIYVIINNTIDPINVIYFNPKVDGLKDRASRLIPGFTLGNMVQEFGSVPPGGMVSFTAYSKWHTTAPTKGCYYGSIIIHNEHALNNAMVRGINLGGVIAIGNPHVGEKEVNGLPKGGKYVVTAVFDQNYPQKNYYFMALD